MSSSRVPLLVSRGLLLRCPNCGSATLASGVLSTHQRCSNCGLLFEHDDAFWLGALIVNYMVTALLSIVPPVVAVARGSWSTGFAIIYAAVVALFFPIVFYWHAKSLWMAIFYFFLPEEMNTRVLAPSDDPTEQGIDAAERERRWVRQALADLEGGRQDRLR